MKRAVVLSLLLVTACTGANGDKYVGAPGSPAWFATASMDTKMAYFGQQCAGYGYRQGTPEMAQCIASETRDARSDARARMAAAGAQMQAASQPQPRRAPTMTNCHMVGNVVNCMSY